MSYSCAWDEGSGPGGVPWHLVNTLSSSATVSIIWYAEAATRAHVVSPVTVPGLHYGTRRTATTEQDGEEVAKLRGICSSQCAQYHYRHHHLQQERQAEEEEDTVPVSKAVETSEKG